VRMARKVSEKLEVADVPSHNLYTWHYTEDGASLVYCAPTGGGKSLVAEVLLIRRLAARAAAG